MAKYDPTLKHNIVNANRLWFGDNLYLFSRIPDGSIDMIYLDPPFNSNVRYGDFAASIAQKKSFDDTWRYDSAAMMNYAFTMEAECDSRVKAMLNGYKSWVPLHGRFAHLVFMTARVIEMHRVLKQNGLLFLHCDDHQSHYLKPMLDAVFGDANHVNDIIRKRHTAHNDSKQGSRHLGRITDTIFVYVKGNKSDNKYTWNTQYKLWTQEQIMQKFGEGKAGERRFRNDGTGRGPYDCPPSTAPGGQERGNPILTVIVDGKSYQCGNNRRGSAYSQANWNKAAADNRVDISIYGCPKIKRYLYEIPQAQRGDAIQNLWDEDEMWYVPNHEKTGWPTQKPVALLHRIIKIGTNEGEIVLDPFAGCGTAIVAAQQLGRAWIGMDIADNAIKLVETRLSKECKGTLIQAEACYDVDGDPMDPQSAISLWKEDRYKFQQWACRRFGFICGPRGPDGGKDGERWITSDGVNHDLVLLAATGGESLSINAMHTLCNSVNQRNAAMGILFTRKSPSKDMRALAAKAGSFEGVSKIQCITIKEAFSGTQPTFPKRKS